MPSSAGSSSTVHHGIAQGERKGSPWLLPWLHPACRAALLRRRPVCRQQGLPSKWQKQSQGESPGITNEESLPALDTAVYGKSRASSALWDGPGSAASSQRLAGPHCITDLGGGLEGRSAFALANLTGVYSSWRWQ